MVFVSEARSRLIPTQGVGATSGILIVIIVIMFRNVDPAAPVLIILRESINPDF